MDSPEEGSTYTCQNSRSGILIKWNLLPFVVSTLPFHPLSLNEKLSPNFCDIFLVIFCRKHIHSHKVREGGLSGRGQQFFSVLRGHKNIVKK